MHASTSENAAFPFLSYHAVDITGITPVLNISTAVSVTIEKIAIRDGVVLAMAQSDH